jgi:hypothetical protein
MRFCAAKRIMASAPTQNITTPPSQKTNDHKGMVGDRARKGMVGDRMDGDAFSRGEKRILRIIHGR